MSYLVYSKSPQAPERFMVTVLWTLRRVVDASNVSSWDNCYASQQPSLKVALNRNLTSRRCAEFVGVKSTCRAKCFAIANYGIIVSNDRHNYSEHQETVAMSPGSYFLQSNLLDRSLLETCECTSRFSVSHLLFPRFFRAGIATRKER